MGALIVTRITTLADQSMAPRLDNWRDFRWDETKALCLARGYPWECRIPDPEDGLLVSPNYPIPNGRYSPRTLLWGGRHLRRITLRALNRRGEPDGR